jgi:3-deoxy-D-manno-octulosonate 8-phosphate phosphatase KdsC-like HAD superfamily phosphatase
MFSEPLPEEGVPFADLVQDCRTRVFPNTMAIGDNYNDLDMFDVCGVSVAMGNSPDEVKAAADHEADDVTRGGAAAVLEAIAAGGFPVAGGGAPGEEIGP